MARTEADAMAMVRAGLCQRIERLEPAARGRAAAGLASGVAQIGSTATEYGLLPLADLAHALGRAIERGAGGHAVSLYIDAMRDAAGCRAGDAAPGPALLASVGLRLAG